MAGTNSSIFRRRMIRRTVLMALLAATCLAQERPAQQNVNPVPRMEEVVQSYVTDKQFMGSVLVARGEKVLLSKGYGSANLEWDIPNSPATKFRLGSVTKQFTAACILLLEERDKLKIDDPLKKYMPDAPAPWEKITIFNLLTHTSGIPNFTSFPDYSSTEAIHTTPEKLVARFRDKPLDFQPGDKWSYSNSGYVLLGYLIAKVSGQSYADFVQQNIFQPLGMKDSGYDSNSAVLAHRASGYSPTPHGPVNAGYIDMTIPLSAGGLYSTTEDLLRWEQGLFGGKLLTPASLEKMTTPFKEDYAFGLGVRTAGGHKVIDHGGGIEGFNTHLAYYPEDKLVVVVLANLNGGAASAMVPKLASVAHGEAVVLSSERKEITLSPQVLSQYVGTYEFQQMGRKMRIRLEGDHLTTQLSGQRRIPISAESETKFFPKVVDAEIEFGKDEKNPYLVLHQGGRDQKAYRTSDKVEERKEVAVPAEIAAQYVGTYELPPNREIVITLENGQLMAQLTEQPRLRLLAESDTRFFFKDVDAQIEFLKDDKGGVNRLILHQGPIELTASRK
jgi:CubicO group peptidase (beta-lactamase class C family)